MAVQSYISISCRSQAVCIIHFLLPFRGDMYYHLLAYPSGEGIQIEHSPECIQTFYNASAFWVSAYNDSFVLSNTVDFAAVPLSYDLDDLEELVVIEMKRFLSIVDGK